MVLVVLGSENLSAAAPPLMVPRLNVLFMATIFPVSSPVLMLPPLMDCMLNILAPDPPSIRAEPLSVPTKILSLPSPAYTTPPLILPLAPKVGSFVLWPIKILSWPLPASITPLFKVVVVLMSLKSAYTLPI